MATITASWTENQSLRSAATLSAGASSAHDIDLAASGYDRVDVQIDITIGSASSVTVQVFGSPDSGTTDDTTSLIEYTVEADDRRTLVLTGAYRQVNFVNNDGTNASGNIAATYAGRKWSSA